MRKFSVTPFPTFLATLALSLSMLGACGAGANVSADKACTDLAQAQCEKRVGCTDSIDPAGVNIERTFGDMTVCLAREKLGCMDNLAASGTGSSPARVETCVDAFPTYACADFLGANPPAVCAPTGSRTAGQPCTFNAQCDSGFCANNKNAICGICAPSPAPGDPCALSNCGHDQICVATTTLCQNRGDVGSLCDASHPCGVELACAGLTGATAGTCHAAVTIQGDPCLGATLPGCQGNLGLACLGPAGSKTCTRITFVGAGEAGGTLADGSRSDCLGGDCITPTGPAAATDLGTCQVKVDAGAACDTNLGPDCLAPARCVPTAAVGTSGTVGTCQMPIAASCG